MPYIVKVSFFVFLWMNFSKLISEEINYRYSLCVTAVFKDEAPYFKEWLEYYKLLGVEHFRLYNNDSTDYYLEVLDPYIQRGEVTLLDWPSDPKRLNAKGGWALSTQFTAFSDALRHFSRLTKWLAIIDLDEFIVPLEQDTLPSFLEKYEFNAGVLINWQNFGTSQVLDIPEGKLMIECLTWKAEENSHYNYPVKSIVRPERVDVRKKGWFPHVWSYISSADYLMLPNQEKWEFGLIDLSKARINHYVHRTEHYFYESKIPKKERMEARKLSDRSIEIWKNSCNKKQDTEIFRFVPALREKMFLED